MNKIVFYLVILSLIILNVSCDKEVSISLVEPDPYEGNLKIATNPNGFSVYLNGKNTGAITPDSLIFLDPGNYEITLKRKYFKDSVFVIYLEKDQKIDLYVDYTQNPLMYGKLNIQSTPVGATISINDSLLQPATPYIIEKILPGEYNIKLTYPQHRDALINATVTSGTIRNYSKTLADTSLWVDYQTANSGLASNNLSCIAIDNYGNKWIGSFDKGLMKFDDVIFFNYKKSNSGLPGDRIFTISVDNQNHIWVGTNEGLGIFDGNSWIVYNKNNSGLISNEIISVKFENNTAWIGAYTGLYKFDGVNWTRYNDFMNTISVNDLAIDNGNIWLATINGIVRLKNEILEYFSDSAYNYPTNLVSSVEIDNSNNVWFCHLNTQNKRNGVSYYNGTQFNNFYFGTSINTMNHISIDFENNKWISTNEGLVRLNSSNSQSTYNRSNSLITSEKVSCTAIDQNGVLWITTFGGGLNKLKSQ